MTNQLQSDFLHMDHVAQQFGRGLFQAHLPHAVVGTTPFTVGVVVIWSLVAFFRSYSRGVRENAIVAQLKFAARFRYNLATAGLHYLVPTGIATTVYVVLSWYIYWFPDHLTNHSLIVIQQAIERASEFFSHHLRLGEWYVLAILFVIYLLSCALLSRKRLGNNDEGATASAGDRWRRLVATLYWAVDVYTKYHGPLAVLLATLASLTFFGTQLGEPSEDLQLQVKEVQGKYTEVTKKTEAELSQRVAIALYTKIRNAFPLSYTEALGIPTQIDSEVTDLQQHIDDAKSRGISDPSVERIFQDEQVRIGKVDELNDLLIESTGRQTVPGDTTYNQIEAARKELGSHPSKAIELIHEGRKKILFRVENLSSGQITRIIKPLIDRIPGAEPLLTVFAEACDETAKKPIEKFYDHAIETAMHNPRDLGPVVEGEAKTIVDETEVRTLVERATPRAQQQSEQLTQKLTSLKEINRSTDVTGISRLPDPHSLPRDVPRQISPQSPSNPPKEPGPRMKDQLRKLTTRTKVRVR